MSRRYRSGVELVAWTKYRAVRITGLYVLAAILLWVGASNAYFDADPRWRSAQQPQPDVAAQADTSRSQTRANVRGQRLAHRR
jgi:peptide methionine sulfoxide reductase MsrB